MTIALRVPVLDEEALRHDQMEVAFVGSNVLPLNETDLIERWSGSLGPGPVFKPLWRQLMPDAFSRQ